MIPKKHRYMNKLRQHEARRREREFDMSLQWSLVKIENNQELCWCPADEDSGKTMQSLTYVLINATIVVGIYEITEKNYKEFFVRLRMSEMSTGPYLTYPNGEINLITLANVKEHIGLSTNATQLSLTEFKNNLFAQIRRCAEMALRAE